MIQKNNGDKDLEKLANHKVNILAYKLRDAWELSAHQNLSDSEDLDHFQNAEYFIHSWNSRHFDHFHLAAVVFEVF